MYVSGVIVVLSSDAGCGGPAVPGGRDCRAPGRPTEDVAQNRGHQGGQTEIIW